MPVAPLGVQDRKPSLAPWIESLGCDLSQLVGICLQAILAIDLEQHVYRRLFSRTSAHGTDTCQHLAQRGARDGQPPRANPGYALFVQRQPQAAQVSPH
jgi:hypothetical protein